MRRVARQETGGEEREGSSSRILFVFGTFFVRRRPLAARPSRARTGPQLVSTRFKFIEGLNRYKFTRSTKHS